MNGQTIEMTTPLELRPTTRSRWRGIALLTVIGIVVLAGTSFLYLRDRLDPGAAVAGVSEVAVRDDDFVPAAIEVTAGTTVTWRWEGAEEHNVVGDDFETAARIEGEFAQTFTEPGTHAYQCTLHFFMRGEVVVTE